MTSATIKFAAEYVGQEFTIGDGRLLITEIEDYIGTEDPIDIQSPFIAMITSQTKDYLDNKYIHWVLAREVIWRTCANAALNRCVAFDEALKAYDFPITLAEKQDIYRGYECDIDDAKDFCFNQRQMVAMQVLFPKSNKSTKELDDLIPDTLGMVAVDDIHHIVYANDTLHFSAWLTEEKTAELIQTMGNLNDLSRKDLLQLNANTFPLKSSRIHVSLAGHYLNWLTDGDNESIERANMAYESMWHTYAVNLAERKCIVTQIGMVHIVSTPALAAKGYFGLSLLPIVGFCTYYLAEVEHPDLFVNHLSTNFNKFLTEEVEGYGANDCYCWLRILWTMLITEAKSLCEDHRKINERINTVIQKWRKTTPTDVNWDENLPRMFSVIDLEN